MQERASFSFGAITIINELPSHRIPNRNRASEGRGGRKTPTRHDERITIGGGMTVTAEHDDGDVADEVCCDDCADHDPPHPHDPPVIWRRAVETARAHRQHEQRSKPQREAGRTRAVVEEAGSCNDRPGTVVNEHAASPLSPTKASTCHTLHAHTTVGCRREVQPTGMTCAGAVEPGAAQWWRDGYDGQDLRGAARAAAATAAAGVYDIIFVAVPAYTPTHNITYTSPIQHRPCLLELP